MGQGLLARAFDVRSILDLKGVFKPPKIETAFQHFGQNG
jgi:hypothetical protein